MALQLVNKGWDITRRRKKSVLLLAAFGITGYGVYRVYNLPSVVKKRKRVFKLLSAFVCLAEAVSDSAEIAGILAKDLREFMKSDSDEIPNSLRQISKIGQSKEFSDSVVRVTAALTRGVFRGYQAESRGDGVGSGSGFYDMFMDKLSSDAGKGFASVVIGSFARNLVMAFYSNEEECEGQSNSGKNMDLDGEASADGSLPGWVDVMCDDRCRELIGDCIQRFVSTAVAVYLEKTMNINTYDELFAGLTNPKHEKQVKDLLVAVCSGSIESLVKTSHGVLTSSNSGSKLGSDSSDLSRIVVTRSNSDVVSRAFYPGIDDARNVITIKHSGLGRGAFLDNMEGRNSCGESKQSGWVSTMSSTLAVPSNRKLVLDVTGRVTFMTVRSFLEFFLDKVFATVKRSVQFVNEAIVDRGLRVVRHVTAKSSVVATICLSLCLHIFGGSTWALMPA